MQELRSLLTALHDEQREAALLVEHNGLTRVNGTIVSIEDGAAGDTIIKLNDHEPVLMKEVVAVNGTFSSDYTEC